MTFTLATRCDSGRNATCRLVWPLRADTRASSNFEVAAGLSGKTLTSESTNQAEKLSRDTAFADREKKQINQTRNLSIISYPKSQALYFCEPVEVMFPSKNHLLRKQIFEQSLSNYLKNSVRTRMR
jgi:hypothetical protein